MSDRLPVVYVRGYAGGPSGIDKAVDDAFYGFNDGSTHVRIGGDGEPLFHQFESPLLRLMIDERYLLLVRGGQHAFLQDAGQESLPSHAVWIYRMYDRNASTFGAADPERFDLLEAAKGLYDFIELVRDRTEGHPKVFLVAHSMGGLVCRAMLQKICGSDDGHGTVRGSGTDSVDKLVTMGTPHGGIETRFALANLLNEVVGVHGSEMFARRNMYEYLVRNAERDAKAPRSWRANAIPRDDFDPERAFCIIGTNPADYGIARKAIGAKSDGLVQVENAYIKSAPRAFVHRSHSGRYGLVNSEESYQNLRRFLFARWRVRVHLVGVDLAGDDVDINNLSPEEMEELLDRLNSDQLEFDSPEGADFWQADVQLTIRGLPVVLHEQAVGKYCPVQLTQEQLRRRLEERLNRSDIATMVDSADTPVPLTTVFLLDRRRFDDDDEEQDSSEVTPPSRYALGLRAFRLRREGGFLGLRKHLEQIADWQDTLIVDIGHVEKDGRESLTAWAAWNSEVAGPNSELSHIAEEPLQIANGAATIPLPRIAQEGIFGTAARLQLDIDEV